MKNPHIFMDKKYHNIMHAWLYIRIDLEDQAGFSLQIVQDKCEETSYAIEKWLDENWRGNGSL